MKVLITGATGAIGSAMLEQCIKHSDITSIVAYSRRALPDSVTSSSKVTVHIVKDFGTWTPEMLDAAKDADAMLWALGMSNSDVAVNYDYPLAFQTAYAQVVESTGRTTPFRFILTSGKFVRQDQDTTLLFYTDARRLKGRLEMKSIELAEAHKDVWRTYILRPGGVVTAKADLVMSLIPSIATKSWTIRAQELGAFAADLAAHGPVPQMEGESSHTFDNLTILERGRELLAR